MTTVEKLENRIKGAAREAMQKLSDVRSALDDNYSMFTFGMIATPDEYITAQNNIITYAVECEDITKYAADELIEEYEVY